MYERNDLHNMHDINLHFVASVRVRARKRARVSLCVCVCRSHSHHMDDDNIIVIVWDAITLDNIKRCNIDSSNNNDTAINATSIAL